MPPWPAMLAYRGRAVRAVPVSWPGEPARGADREVCPLRAVRTAHVRPGQEAAAVGPGALPRSKVSCETLPEHGLHLLGDPLVVSGEPVAVGVQRGRDARVPHRDLDHLWRRPQVDQV